MSALSANTLPDRRQAARLGILHAFSRKADLRDLLNLAGSALGFWPPLYGLSIFGPVGSWRPPHRELSEFRIVDPLRAVRALRYLGAAGIPGVDRHPPALLEALLPGLLNDLFWRPTTVFEHPEPRPGGGEHPGERWFFINGMATNQDVARMNAALIARLFGRPITVIQNATNSFFVDLFECAIGKGFRTDPDLADRGTFTDPGLVGTITILEALNRKDVDKVVVLAHSQGTIIVANVLRAITKALNAVAAAGRRETLGSVAREVALELTVETPGTELRQHLADALAVFVERRQRAVHRVEKLEIYTFANCADKMRWVLERDGGIYPWLEHFANRRDLVARLGVLSPHRGRPELVAIDGPVYVKSSGGGWGHFLNEHYLFHIEEYLESSNGVADPYPAETRRQPAVPRLYGYFAGGCTGPPQRPAA